MILVSTLFIFVQFYNSIHHTLLQFMFNPGGHWDTNRTTSHTVTISVQSRTHWDTNRTTWPKLYDKLENIVSLLEFCHKYLWEMDTDKSRVICIKIVLCEIKHNYLYIVNIQIERKRLKTENILYNFVQLSSSINLCSLSSL